MAQDFFAAFRVGTDDKHISMVDADGVALAAIQGLDRKLQDKDAEIVQKLQEKENEIARLQQQNAWLARRLDTLEQTVQGLAWRR